MHDVSQSSAVRWHAWPESKHAASPPSGQAGSATPPQRPLSSLPVQAIDSTPALTVPAAAAQLDRLRTLARDLPAVARLLGRHAPSEVGLLQEAWKQAQGLAPTATSQLAEQSHRLHALARSVSALAARDVVRRAPAGEGVRPRQTLESLADLLREQARHVDQLVTSSPFNARRVHEARAALWDAAADLLEADVQVGVARDIRAAGAKAGLSVKPGTPLEPYLEVLRDFDTLLVMSVEPGFGGQSFIPDVLDKVRTARRLVDAGELTILVEIDGGINADTIEAAAEAGVDCFVAGSAVYGAADPGRAVAALREQAAAHWPTATVGAE